MKEEAENRTRTTDLWLDSSMQSNFHTPHLKEEKKKI